MRMPPVIYQIIVAGDGRSYIGSASYFPTRRSHHLWALRNCTHHCVKLRRAVVKHGIEAVSFNILEEVADRTKLLEREQYWLDQHQGHLFNKSPTATPGASLKLTPEQKAAVSKFHTGRKRSAESRAKMSASMRGNTNGRHTRKDFCKRGHPLSGDNLYTYQCPTRIARWCKQCLIDKSRARHGFRSKRKEFCIRGHPLSGSNLYTRDCGTYIARNCRQCALDASKRRRMNCAVVDGG